MFRIAYVYVNTLHLGRSRQFTLHTAVPVRNFDGLQPATRPNMCPLPVGPGHCNFNDRLSKIFTCLMRKFHLYLEIWIGFKTQKSCSQHQDLTTGEDRVIRKRLVKKQCSFNVLSNDR
ncbi:hypothetical protein PoB_002826500 [Plakobranchus ocellatus]|uniref:Uncharacterized protein n=1 Tax=Plakobranchus ocellatus TaxID=259542 RepID=A0AAV4A325_9GAST|nr:hypothetical protein PoB_002826500 [Plakobranchus ocellatus]